MAKLYRGVCRELDERNEGSLRPKGSSATIKLRRDGSLQGMRRDGKFSRGDAELNAVRAHHLASGFNGGCFVSFTKSREKAIQFAIRDNNGDKTDGFIYEVEEALFEANGVVSREFENPEYPGELEVTLRASDCGDLPAAIVISKTSVFPDDYV